MRKFTKWLSLLMAGMLLSTTLIACNDGFDWTEEDDDDDEEQSESSQYKELGPEEVGDALSEAEKFTITLEIRSGSEVENIVQKRNFIKNGDLMKSLYNITSEGFSSESEVYVDLKNNKLYQQEDGLWYVENEETDLDELISDVLLEDLLLDNRNYREYDSETGRYTLKEDDIRDTLGVPEDAAVEGYMARKGSTYTFFLKVDSNGGREYTITVEFTAEKITLPEVQTPATDEDNEESAVPSPMPDER